MLYQQNIFTSFNTNSKISIKNSTKDKWIGGSKLFLTFGIAASSSLSTNASISKDLMVYKESHICGLQNPTYIEKSKMKKCWMFLRICSPRKIIKNISSFRWKNIFQANALKVGATSNIIHELRKIFQKIKGLKKLWMFLIIFWPRNSM